ncbi:MAG: ImmA/IrrE family metallo-endopeptidase [Magnetococcales bacterium]|nr:ImmA/IrrE family metallo-endopeptidase [Magnetococcales bacterium]
MAMNVRMEFGKRLSHELKRRGFDKGRMPPDLSLDVAILQEYQNGKRKVNLSEIGNICKNLGINPVYFISSNYSYPTLSFRNAKKEHVEFALKIEDAVLTIQDCFPDFCVPDIEIPKFIEKDFFDIIDHVVSFLDRFKFSNVESLLGMMKIMILPIRPPADIDYDAFLVITKSKGVICLNPNKPPVRQHFSILYELAHFIFDREKGFGIDVLPNNLYNDRIEYKFQPEFIANKFAQYFLVPAHWAIKASYAWPMFHAEEAQKILNERKTSPQVMVNALCDQLRRLRSGADSSFLLYREIGEKLNSCVLTSGDASFIKTVISQHAQEIKKCLLKNQGKYSSEIFAQIMYVLQLE